VPKPTEFNRTLAGKVAIVTGAGTEGDAVGIGRAIAFLLAAEGAKICLVDLSLAAAKGTQALIEAQGGEAFATAGDVTKREDCARFVSETLAKFGKLDVLVNNVGIGTPVPLKGDDESGWHQVMDVNVTSAMLMSRYSIPEMIKIGGGSIVNIVSIAGMLAYGSIAYGPSKAAMIQLTRELCVTYGNQGIRANSIAPGHMVTPMVEKLLPPEMREVRRAAGPLGVEGDAWDIAKATRFFASDEARFISGVLLPVDGGVTVTGSLVAHAMIDKQLNS